jgi:hypothetical protein
MWMEKRWLLWQSTEATPYSSGRSQGGGQAPRERLSPDDATTGTRLLRGVRRMAAYGERSEAWSYVLLARRRSLVVGYGP